MSQIIMEWGHFFVYQLDIWQTILVLWSCHVKCVVHKHFYEMSVWRSQTCRIVNNIFIQFFQSHCVIPSMFLGMIIRFFTLSMFQVSAGHVTQVKPSGMPLWISGAWRRYAAAAAAAATAALVSGSNFAPQSTWASYAVGALPHPLYTFLNQYCGTYHKAYLRFCSYCLVHFLFVVR